MNVTDLIWIGLEMRLFERDKSCHEMEEIRSVTNRQDIDVKVK